MLAYSSALISGHFPFCHMKQVDPGGRGSTEATRNSLIALRSDTSTKDATQERRRGRNIYRELQTGSGERQCNNLVINLESNPFNPNHRHIQRIKPFFPSMPEFSPSPFCPCISLVLTFLMLLLGIEIKCLNFLLSPQPRCGEGSCADFLIHS